LIAKTQAGALNYSKAIPVGHVSDFDKKALEAIDAKVIVRDGLILLIECPYDTHEMVGSLLAFDLVQALQNLNIIPDTRIVPSGASTFKGYVNYLHCGSKGVAKIPDAQLGLIGDGDFHYPPRVSKSVVFETALRNESLVTLLNEGACWLNQQTDTVFSFLVKVVENETQSDVMEMNFFVFERTRLMKTGTPNTGPKMCRKWSSTDDEVKNLTNEDLDFDLQIKVIHRQVITRDTLRAGIEVIVNMPLVQLGHYFDAPILCSSPPRLTLQRPSSPCMQQ
jgi:hypothetical protein